MLHTRSFSSAAGLASSSSPAAGLASSSFPDPYLNTDAGTMSPFERGEVFVLDDGGEVDLDLGNYERFLDITLTKEDNREDISVCYQQEKTRSLSWKDWPGCASRNLCHKELGRISIICPYRWKRSRC